MSPSRVRFSLRTLLLGVAAWCLLLVFFWEFFDSRKPYVVRWPDGCIRGIYEIRFDAGKNSWVTNGDQVEFSRSGEVYRRARMSGVKFRSPLWEMKMDMYGCSHAFINGLNQLGGWELIEERNNSGESPQDSSCDL